MMKMCLRLLLVHKRQSNIECSDQLMALLNDSVTHPDSYCSLKMSTACVGIQCVVKGNILG